MTMTMGYRQGDQVVRLQRQVASELNGTACRATVRPRMDGNEVERLCVEFADLFAEPQGLPPPRAHDHHINLLLGTKPVVVRQHQNPFPQKDEIERQ